MKKNDIILGIIILLVAGTGLLYYMNLGDQEAAKITITVDNKLFGTYSLDEEQEIPINNTNYLIIKDHKADMIDANCPDKNCVNQKAISKNKETIICLPNEVVVEVVGGKEAGLDAVTN